MYEGGILKPGALEAMIFGWILLAIYAPLIGLLLYLYIYGDDDER